ncbi:MAG: ABC transporter permease [Lachnospiraceae bacterium]|nr:ABC transporter permease [Lachnospiraceae bacterium]
MKYLNIKMLRDMKQNFTQFIAVFLMAAISVLIFSGMASVWTGLNKVVSDEVSDTNMADYYIKALGITGEDKEKLLKTDGIDKVSLSAEYTFSASDGQSEINITTVDSYDVSSFTLLKGKELLLEGQGIYLDSDYASEHNLKTGDILKIDNIAGECIEIEISGLVHSPEYFYFTGAVTETVPNYEKYGYGFVSNQTFEKLCMQLNYTTAKVKGNYISETGDFEEIFGERFICVQDRGDFAQYSRSEKESSQMKKMATLFSAVFILLSLLTMYTSMVRLVDRQKEAIGTMKGLGVKTKQILIHYASYGIFVPLLGGILGLIIGRFTVSKALMKVKQTTLYLPEWKLIHSPYSFVLIAGIMICCVFASVMAAKKVLKGNPVEIMRGNTNNSKMKKEVKETSLINHFPYGLRLAFRNIAQNKIRFIMGIVGVMGGMVLIIAGFGVKDAINSSNEFVFSKQFTYDIKGILKNSDVELEDVQYLYETAIELQTADEIKQTSLSSFEAGEFYNFYDNKENKIGLPDKGALISRHLADEMGITAGDNIKIRIPGRNEWINIYIQNTVKMLSPQGLFISKTALENAGAAFKRTGFVTDSHDANYYSDISGVKNVITRSEQLENTELVADSVMSIVKLLIMASVLLSVVILYNLGILNYVERVREYSTMKVLGFYQREIRSIAILECVITTIIGWVLGLILGRIFLKVYIKIISFDTFEWLSDASIATYVIASVIIIGVSLLVNLLLAHKIRKIVMVEALKSVE